MRITAACPEAFIADANQLAMCLGRGPADAHTYGTPRWYDEDGNAYAAASWETTSAWVDWAQLPVTRPAWDVDGAIDMTAATRAYDALVLSETLVLASPSALTALIGDDGRASLRAMGLTDQEPAANALTDAEADAAGWFPEPEL